MASITDGNYLFLNQGKNPLVNFNFMLRVEMIYDLPCKSVRAFSRELEYDFVQEGGLNDYVHMLRKPISRPFTLEVERYVGVDYIDPLPLGAELTLPVFLFVSRAHDQFIPFVVARTYTFTGCTVMKKTYGDLIADQSGLLVETTTIGYREMVCVDIPWSETGDNIFAPPLASNASTLTPAATDLKMQGKNLYNKALEAKTRSDSEYSETEITKLITDMEDVLKTLSQSVASGGTLRAAKETAEKNLVGSDGKTLWETAEASKQSARTAEAAMREKEQVWQEKNRAYQKAKDKADDFQAQITETNARISDYNSQLERDKQDKESLRKTIPETIADAKAAAAARDAAQSTYEDAREQLQEAQEEYNDTRYKLQQQIEPLVAKKDSALNAAPNSKERNKEAKEKASAAVAEAEENAKAADEVLKTANEAVKTADAALLTAQKNAQAKNKAGVEAAEAAIAAAEEEVRNADVVLEAADAAVARAQEALTAAATSETADAQQELERAQSEQAKAQSVRNDAQAAVDAAKAEIKEIKAAQEDAEEDDKENLQQHLKEKETALQQAEAALKSAEEALAAAGTSVSKAEAALAEVTTDKQKDAQSELEEKQAAQKDALDDRKKAEEALKNAKAARDEAEKAAAEDTQEVLDAKDKLQSARKKQEQAQEKKDAADRALKEARDAEAKVVEESAASKKEQEEAIAAEKAAREAMNTELARLQADIDTANEMCNAAKKELDNCEMYIQHFEKLDELEKRITDTDAKLAAARTDLTALTGRKTEADTAATEAKGAVDAVGYEAARTAWEQADKKAEEDTAKAVAADRTLSDAGEKLDKGMDRSNKLQNCLTNLKSRKKKASAAQSECTKQHDQCKTENDTLQALPDEPLPAVNYQFEQVKKYSKQTVYNERQVRETVFYIETAREQLEDARSLLGA